MFLLFGIFSLFYDSPQARTWYIKPDSTGDAPTIQAGVDSSVAGDTVLVAPGIYSDTRQVLVNNERKTINLHIKKNIQLIAEEINESAIIDGSDCDIAIYVENVDSTAKMEGFKIFTKGEGYICFLGANETTDRSINKRIIQPEPNYEPIGVKCINSSLAITGNEICENRTAIELTNSPIEIIGNTIYDNIRGILCCDDSSDAFIMTNNIYNCQWLIASRYAQSKIIENDLYVHGAGQLSCYGIWCYSSSSYIANNRIIGMTTIGIYCIEGNPIIENNWLQGNGEGIKIQSYSGSVIGNILYDNIWAISILGITAGAIENNTIDLGSVAIVVEAGSSVLIYNNIITRFGEGVNCDPFSLPSFHCNNIYDVANPYSGYCPDHNGINGNFSAEPQFCGTVNSGNYYLQSDSPCAPGNHPDGYNCGLIGAFGPNCGTDPVEDQTWGSIKSLYKKAKKDSLTGKNSKEKATRKNKQNYHR